MAKENTVKAIAKVMIAAAWADGRITNDEINSLKDLLFRLPDMTASDWAELEIYIESPIDEEERMRLVESLRRELSSQEEKRLALDSLGEIVSADGEITESERALMDEISPLIESSDVSMLGPLSKLMRGSIKRHSRVVAEAHNREIYLDDFINHRVFYLVSRRMEMEGEQISVSDSLLRKLSLAGGLMARVAYVDRDVNESEFDAMADILEETWDVTPLEAAVIAEVAVSQIGAGMETYGAARALFETTSEEQRVKFLDVLFAVAGSDGFVTYEETEEIRLISKLLKLSHSQFIDAKLKISPDKRSS
ncbi:MAG: TerB family tellurite resistance protein [Anaerolineales bacterium]|jgi:uncharacterized tellurite resistance protein B-like protein